MFDINDPRETRIFVHRLLANQKAFVLNNIMRMKEMMRYGSPAFRAVFQAVPYCLQLNRANTPGFIENGEEARGIFGFERSGYARLFRENHPDENIRKILTPQPCIQSLMLIGSVGSVGHTALSDLDYWVLINRARMDSRVHDLLAEKLDLITRWAGEKQGVEVHFFLLDLKDLKKGHLGGLDDDSSGNVMPRLLKEEFYRTALHVAGRLPLWWVVPEGVEEAEYEWIVAHLDQLMTTAFDSEDYVDLGFVTRPGPKEYLGAAMWQMHKARVDPFKAVLKMILLLEQVENDFSVPLLCNEIKTLVLGGRSEFFPVDPYLITIERVLAFIGNRLPKYAELVRQSILFKLLPPVNQMASRELVSKQKVFDRLKNHWGWEEKTIREYLEFSKWPVRKKLALGEEVKAMLLDLYSRTASRLRAKYPDEMKVDDQALRLLNAQILAHYTSHQRKVEELSSAFLVMGLPKKLTLVLKDGWWRLEDPVGPQGDFVFKALSLIRIAAWMVHNRIWHSDLAMNFFPDRIPIKKKSLILFLEFLAEIFPPVSLKNLKDLSLIGRPEGLHALVLNFEQPNHQGHVHSADVLCRTSLGEMLHYSVPLTSNLEKGAAYFELAAQVLKDIGPRYPDVRFFIAPGLASGELRENIEVAFQQYDRKLEKKQLANRGSKLKLDRF